MTDNAKTLEMMITMDPTLAPFWMGAAKGQVMIQRCNACGSHQFPPRPFCLTCDAEAPDWVPAAGQGMVYSLTTSHLPPDPGTTVALVQLDEGPKLLAVTGGGLRIGDRVHLSTDADRIGRPRLKATAI